MALTNRIFITFKYLWETTDESHPVSLANISAFLKQHGITADPRTLRKDIEQLTEFGVDIVKDRRVQNLYHVATRHFEAPEVKLLIDAVQSARFITTRKSKALIDRLSSFVAPGDTALLKRHLYIDSRSKATNESIYLNVDQIQTAITERKKISFCYFDYSRISSEDVDLKTGDKDESESISNQRRLLRDYVCGHADLSGSEILEFCDDGWSGTNFERPAIKELLEQVKRGKINCIVVKDFSRFGRDYITVGDYISRVFPFLGVHFISVNDGFDSINPQDIDSLDTSFRTLIYDLYSRDLSRKVRSARKARAERDAFLSPYAPYGYIKDPEDKNHLLVDEEAASVIRRIFQRAADGLKTWEIAAELNGDGVCSPKNHKVNAGCTRKPWRSIQEDNFWTAGLVAKFLRDERYIGKVVFGKRVRDVVGSTHTVKISRNDWIVVPDRHEAIVSESLFDAAQACMREYRECESPTDSGKPLKRKVVCGVCGHVMKRDGKKNASYSCGTKRLNTGFDCSDEKVPESDILDAVIETIQVYAQYAVSIDRLLRARQNQRQLDRKQAQRQLQTLQSKKMQLDKRLQDFYEQLVEGELSRESFAAQKKSMTAQMEEISRTISELERKASSDDGSSNALIEKFKSYAGITALTKEISNDLLKSVAIYPDGYMDIQLNLVDEIQELMETLRRESCTA